MAEVRVDVEFLRARLFPSLNAWITGVRFDGDHTIFISMEGPDVPEDCDEVMAIVTVKSETIHLEPISASKTIPDIFPVKGR